MLEAILDSRQGGGNTGRVSDVAAADGNVEVDAHQHALALNQVRNGVERELAREHPDN